MTDSYVSRADLVRALAFRQPDVTVAVADLLGLEYREPTATSGGVALATPLTPPATSTVESTPFNPAPVRLWRMVRETVRGEIERVTRHEAEREKVDPNAPRWRLRPVAEVSWEPLAQRREVLTKLRTRTGTRASRGEIDIEHVVDRLSRGEFLHELQRRRRRTWGSGLFLLQDRARHLVPYWQDQDYLARLLQDYYPHYGLTVARRYSAQRRLEVMLPECRAGLAARPNATDVVLVVSDLGVLSVEPADREFWIDFGRDLNQAGLLAIALTPCQPDHIDASLRQLYRIVPWEASVTTPAGNEDSPLERLMTLVSPATRLEPGLLRAIRRLLPEMRGHADLESRVWTSELVSSPHSVAASYVPGVANRLRAAFRQLPVDQQLAVVRLIRDWRGGLHEAVWFEELLGLDRRLQNEFRQDTSDARETFKQLFAEVTGRREKGTESWLGFQSWGRGLWRRLPGQVKSDPIIGQTFHQLWEAVRSSSSQDVEGFDPVMVGADPRFDHPVEVNLWQQGDLITARREGCPARASWLGRITTLNRRIVLSPRDGDRPWTPDRPAWANGVGRDQFGFFADFEFRGITQRLRWIPAGSFRMGSPGTEAGRDDNEGPCHEVTLSSDFWLFDTPCTQALWQAVMDKNPSSFVSPDRPVDSVSWNDAQEFVRRLNGELPGLDLTLPTEAQWEYACRAGTSDATWLGNLEILGDSNAPLLDAIAWYGGNTGVAFDLDNGWDSSGWPEKQYEHERAGTRRVKQKSANPWGLYDMLGNVWEWCLDGRRKYSDRPEIDPVGPTDPGADRVLRGGGWFFHARVVRAAFRVWDAPDSRFGDIGFRCARVQAGGAESLRSGSERRAEHRVDRAAAHGAVDFNLTGGDVTARPIPAAERLVVTSDLQEIELEASLRPVWANSFGRDHYGLFADLEYRDVAQRLRWIPPGRFQMGSPPSEAGRYDDEGPGHEVTLSSGFWLFDTPCTQDLWQAVMGKNPSHFVSPARPVDSVSWQDAQEFLQRLNGELPGLDLTLPTEAQWEYACRAGTSAATWRGDLEILGQHNAPLLDEIAWYGGNCGVEFDLDNGYNSSEWAEKQHEHVRAGTRMVKQKSANPWGLYDMLGNVWEWCLDGRRDYSDEPEIDPIGPTESGALRVLRGGSWFGHARFVRAAYRHWGAPVNRLGDFGFRCARVQAAQREAAEVWGASERRAEHRADRPTP